MPLILTLALVAAAPPRAETAQGVLEGVATRRLGRDVDRFLGIPFAEPPVGPLRFQPPRPPRKWAGIRRATDLPNSCIQGIDRNFGRFPGVEMWNANTNRSEDCLYLNIWSPRQNGSALPVLLWIYGGGFFSGTSTLQLYDGATLSARENLVVVTINYRVGMLGFIALGHPRARGNAGLYDQLMAMKWVRHNIANFGGDPDRVTLYGESAGAASVSIHLVSKLSRPYFSRAIMGSGAATSSWAVIPYEEAKRRSLLVAKKYLKCPGEAVDSILGCLLAIANPLLIAQFQFYTVGGISQFPFVPVVDGHLLVDHPSSLLRRGDFKRCPLLMGTVKNEGNYFILYESLPTYDMDNGSSLNSSSYSRTMAHLFHYYPIYPFVAVSPIIELIKFFYMPWRRPFTSSAYAAAVDSAVGDAFFICGLEVISEAYSYEGIPLFYYRFWHRSSRSVWPPWMGVIHGDELTYTFGIPLVDRGKYLPQEVELSKRILRYWGNFVRTGDPNKDNNVVSGLLLPYWPRFTHRDKKYIFLKTQSPEEPTITGTYPRAHQCAFWNLFLPLAASELKYYDRQSSSFWKSPKYYLIVIFLSVL